MVHLLVKQVAGELKEPSLSIPAESGGTPRGAARKHVVDREVAALFYETVDYYHAFEKSFALARAGVETLAKRLEAENRPVEP